MVINPVQHTLMVFRCPVLSLMGSADDQIRPGALLFDLICDGEVQETVELTAGDLWRYQWDELDNTHQWRIVEHAAGNYRVSARQEGITVVLYSL